ncbi:MAG: lysophospholipid acyltransferase family protein [Fimbriimonas sp.]
MADDWVVGPRPAIQRFLWLPIGRVLTTLFLFVLGPVRVRGAYRVPREGGVLILSNHLSDIDPAVVQYACPRAPHYMAKSELFEVPVLRTLLRIFGSFPVKRGEPDRKALKHAADLLKAGEAVVIFPEGQLSESGDLQEMKAGVALIARLSAGVPVICVGLDGTQRIIPYGKLIPRPAFRTVTVEWGEPRTFDKGTDAQEILNWISGQLRMLGNYKE